MVITAELVQNLIAEQFPQWKDLPVRPVEKSGHDNRTFHLGDAMSVRLPSGKAYEAQVQKESRWLPYLQAQLDYPISAPLAVGRPCAQYPYFWSINRWIEGCTLRDEAPADRTALARALAAALKKLQQIDCTGGPAGGAHNFYRGCSPAVYEEETRAALDKLRERLPVDRLAAVWERCIAEPYTGGAVWVHGDVAPASAASTGSSISASSAPGTPPATTRWPGRISARPNGVFFSAVWTAARSPGRAAGPCGKR